LANGVDIHRDGTVDRVMIRLRRDASPATPDTRVTASGLRKAWVWLLTSASAAEKLDAPVSQAIG
jgi:hypothetical protein